MTPSSVKEKTPTLVKEEKGTIKQAPTPPQNQLTSLKNRLWVGRHRSFQAQLINIEADSQEQAWEILCAWCNQEIKRGKPVSVWPFISADPSILEAKEASKEAK